ncbi:MAG TPA: MBL fold metallo-hydrolase [Roseiflexaceae bacterium]|nr:MBL fold metallo-hydrolase [Roseiflexaceae bacterium]
MTPTDTEQSIDYVTLSTWLAEGRPLTLLDVRPLDERREWALPGSVHVDVYDRLKAGDTTALTGVDLPADMPVVTICAAGKTSLIAAEQLRARGLHAMSLDGGMRAWSLAWNTANVALPESVAQVIQVRRTGKGCLSYIIGAAGVAAIIDPSLDPEIYCTLAAQAGWRIAYVLETHLHADHLSRARALADRSGATLVLPAGHRVAVPFVPLHDGAALTLGDTQLTMLHTPGHTPESVTYLLDDAAIFTGDTLFLSAVGRPDLHADAAGARAKAHTLYGSLQRLLTLPPETLVLPGHTSAPVAFDYQPIAASLAAVRHATPLLAATAEDFVAAILARIPPTPPNHMQIIALNEQGAAIPADPTELEAGANRCAIA